MTYIEDLISHLSVEGVLDSDVENAIRDYAEMKRDEIVKLGSLEFSYGSDEFNISTYGTVINPLFRLKEIGILLGCRNIKESLRTLDIPDEWKILKKHNNMTFINEFALYKILLKSNKPIAKDFLNFLSQILPLMRKTGRYNVNERKIDYEIKMNIYNTVFNVFKQIGMDKHDETMFKDFGRSLITEGFVESLCGKTLYDATSSPGDDTTSSHRDDWWSLSQRLMEVYKTRLTNNKLMMLGKRVAKTYRNIRDDEPLAREQLVDGTIRLVKHYTSADYKDFIDSIIEEFLNE